MGSAGGADGVQRVASGDRLFDEFKEATGGAARNDIERDQGVLEADEIAVMGIEDAEIVRGPVIRGGGDFLEPERGEPGIDLSGGNRHDIEARLGGDDDQLVQLDDEAFEPIELRNEEVVKLQALEVFERAGLPKVEAAGILRGRDERKFDAGLEAEDPIAGRFPIAVGGFIVPEIVLLAALDGLRGEIRRI